MTDLELEAVVKGVTDAVLANVKRDLATMFSRLDAYEKAMPVIGPVGPQGPQGEKGIDGVIGERGLMGPAGEKGDPGDAGLFGPQGPQGEKGIDGRDGESVSLEQVSALVDAAVAKAIAALPVPQDGKDGRDGVNGVDGKDGAPGLNGKDGADGLHGKDGADGLIGPQGLAGRDGLPGVPGQTGERGEKGLDGKDGLHGKDGAPGRDGTLEHLKIVKLDDRTLAFQFKDGTPIDGGESIQFDWPLYRGVYQAGRTYDKGDHVTWGGSMWTAMQPTSSKPGENGQESRSWVLSAQRGRDGKVGPEGKTGPPGVRGEMGPQGRSGY